MAQTDEGHAISGIVGRTGSLGVVGRPQQKGIDDEVFAGKTDAPKALGRKAGVCVEIGIGDVVNVIIGQSRPIAGPQGSRIDQQGSRATIGHVASAEGGQAPGREQALPGEFHGADMGKADRTGREGKTDQGGNDDDEAECAHGKALGKGTGMGALPDNDDRQFSHRQTNCGGL